MGHIKGDNIFNAKCIFRVRINKSLLTIKRLNMKCVIGDAVHSNGLFDYSIKSNYFVIFKINLK